jgi:hypothetical protein
MEQPLKEDEDQASLRKTIIKNNLANSTMKAREFNIISNRYHEGHEKKLSQTRL